MKTITKEKIAQVIAKLSSDKQEKDNQIALDVYHLGMMDLAELILAELGDSGIDAGDLEKAIAHNKTLK